MQQKHSNKPISQCHLGPVATRHFKPNKSVKRTIWVLTSHESEVMFTLRTIQRTGYILPIRGRDKHFFTNSDLSAS